MSGRASRKGGDDSRCPSCSAPVLRQLVGNRAALNVTADLQPLTRDQQATASTPNRLIWCLKTAGPHSTPRLCWTGRSHPADCAHPHVAEHQCPPAEPTTLF
ncbi:hypothetical protein [Streptomyces sp. NRRL B-24720]|uniref:hypothetical protein n=1 Tax=Streptomyces sp. NRRL B-24720 TaxID=1476876 RepID=UPI0004C8413C|nr:hypothetical protein [Streptomyces sp. NRRL B-24720]